MVSTPYVSSRSPLGKTMTAIAIVGIIVNYVLLVLFVVKRNHPVIKAASKSFSFLILLGESNVPLNQQKRCRKLTWTGNQVA